MAVMLCRHFHHKDDNQNSTRGERRSLSGFMTVQSKVIGFLIANCIITYLNLKSIAQAQIKYTDIFC